VLKVGKVRTLLWVNSHEEKPPDSTPYFLGVRGFVRWRFCVIIGGHATTRRCGPFDLDLPILIRGELWF